MDEAGPSDPESPQVAASGVDDGLGQRQSSLRVPALLWVLILSDCNVPLSHCACHRSPLFTLSSPASPGPSFCSTASLRQTPPVPHPEGPGGGSRAPTSPSLLKPLAFLPSPAPRLPLFTLSCPPGTHRRRQP